MPNNVTTDSGNESRYPDEEDWQIALAPYEGRPRDVLSLAFHFAELKRLVGDLKKHEAIATIDLAIDCLYEHSDFRSAGRELFLVAIEGKLTTDKEELVRHLGIRI